MTSLKLLSSESVTEGHPDKLCDCISDAILDECLSRDPGARVAVEVFVKGFDSDNENDGKSFIVIGGEITLKNGVNIDYEKIARETAAKIGYTSEKVGMNALSQKTCEVLVLVGEQSEEISQGVTVGEGMYSEQGAGDQGIMFGYASNESEKFDSLKGILMPLPIILSQKLTTAITDGIKNGDIPWGRPDGKSQVTVAYNDNGDPEYVDTVVIAIQHDNLAEEKFEGNIEREFEFIRKEVEERIVLPTIPSELIGKKLKLIVNGTGRFVKGGPSSDAGLTGRKIIVDTYGGLGAHGGGAFSGKDPSKVDRSGAYAARWAAKHVVSSGLADKCQIQLAYAIGVANPISVNVDTFDTSKFNEVEIEKQIKKIFDFRPSKIIDILNLKRPIYRVTAAGGHFGRVGHEGEFPWEVLDSEIISNLKSAFI
jgi:S-adenosylmethionine synthetase